MRVPLFSRNASAHAPAPASAATPFAVLTAAVLAASVACAPTADLGTSDDRSYDSVRDRLASDETTLFIGGDDSTGAIVARRWSRDGWLDSERAIGVERGALAATLDDDGDLVIVELDVSIEPIEIPVEVFKVPAQITDVRFMLRTPAHAPATWLTDNESISRVSLSLDLQWSLTIGGGKTPLGTQHFPPLDIDVALRGTGDLVEARLGLAARGELWNWAGLLKLVRLDLALSAATVEASKVGGERDSS